MVSDGDEVSASLLAGCATASDIGLCRQTGCPPGYGGGRLRAWHTGATSTTFCRSGSRKRLGGPRRRLSGSLLSISPSPDESGEQADTETEEASTYECGVPDERTTKREADQCGALDLPGMAHFSALVVPLGTACPSPTCAVAGYPCRLRSRRSVADIAVGSTTVSAGGHAHWGRCAARRVGSNEADDRPPRPVLDTGIVQLEPCRPIRGAPVLETATGSCGSPDTGYYCVSWGWVDGG
jgi:hypothetical protein